MGVEGQTVSSAVEMTGLGRRVLIIVENLPCPFDRRVWQEARTLARGGLSRCRSSARRARATRRASRRSTASHIYRHALPFEAERRARLLRRIQLGAARWNSRCRCRCCWTRGFDVIHACNPPDTIFLIGGFYKLFGKKFLFDHHDINPELYEAKFGRRDFFYRLMVWLER